jgi:hypothetical protein
VVVPDRHLVPGKLRKARQRANGVEIVVQDGDVHGEPAGWEIRYRALYGTRRGSLKQGAAARGRPSWRRRRRCSRWAWWWGRCCGDGWGKVGCVAVSAPALYPLKLVQWPDFGGNAIVLPFRLIGPGIAKMRLLGDIPDWPFP